MSEVEIVSYIATGHSAADKSSSSSSDQSASLAKDIGLSQVTGFAEEAAQEAIGLDVLQVRFDALQGATLVAGRYIDPQLYVGFRQPLQYKDTSSPTSSVNSATSVEVEYAIYRWLVLNLQGETSKVRSFIRARHAY
jgi:autotransporter translocation and assembly factor TamB